MSRARSSSWRTPPGSSSPNELPRTTTALPARGSPAVTLIRRLHLERHVFLAGFRADVLELLKSFDVFALTSTHEGMCTSLVDAMAAQKPAVATAVGGVPEVMADGETGFLVPAHHEAAVAEKLAALLKDGNLRRRMGDAALARARELFTVERMVAETAAVYERFSPWR